MGKGPLLERYKQEASDKNLNNISFLGFIDDQELIKLYARCDLVLLIADYGEGFGLPIIEGYLFNKPVIASNKCAIPEVIISVNHLFENNVNDIIDKIQVINNFESYNYREYYYSKFSNVKIMSQIKNIYLSFSS